MSKEPIFQFIHWVNPFQKMWVTIIVDGYASLFNCTTAVRASDSMTAFNQWVGAWRYVFGLARRGSTIGFHLLWHTVELAMSSRLCLL